MVLLWGLLSVHGLRVWGLNELGVRADALSTIARNVSLSLFSGSMATLAAAA